MADLPNWHYLTGSAAQLASVWLAYGGVANPALAGRTVSPDQLERMAIIYFIDPKGRLRVALPSDFRASDFLQDVKVLSQSS